jgi:solute carrier family 25 S-adenosylmethionine transporter 26
MTINAPSDPIVSLVAGASAGLAVDIALYPLDTLKTRLQSPLGFFKSGGFRGIYRGISAAAIGSAPSAALFFLAYDSCKHIAGHLLSAWIGELSACLVRVPTDNVKQKIQAGVFRDMKSAISGISGIRGFFTGYWTTVAREIPFAGVQFPLYEYLKNQMEVDAPISGAIAGGVAAFVSTPLDVAKTRQMIEVRTDKYVGRSMWHVLRTIYNEEGMRKLFSGASARVAWISIGGFVFFGAYETVRKSLLRGKDKEER